MISFFLVAVGSQAYAIRSIAAAAAVAAVAVAAVATVAVTAAVCQVCPCLLVDAAAAPVAALVFFCDDVVLGASTVFAGRPPTRWMVLA